ncbi:MAG: PadR family transcriptional regulator [Saccharolobus sp.]|jgi:DNA-binding PadR family transcriptional regulator|uniref:Transcription regulator PadR N-terminal domain-containing protein n=1 Tax=Saccharolobus caldissimus TaxID=1702097 RepID=A0AAQ4CPY1_9CREN|nr:MULTISPECIES: PadR family transcriptional regulator [Saccharolobus]MDT7861050.1 PadR family transcriptional regulator [Saccharolobus sp.]BDB97862.1 hypothetical protein SACC_08790 [Saccharolobus caldissimus]
MPRKTEMILRGVITLYVLKLLINGPKHGYELEKIISEKLNYKLPDGSIYVILKSLVQKKMVTVESMKNNKGQTVKKYHITEKGTKFFLSHEKPLIAVRNVIDELIQSIEEIKGQK